MIADQRFFAEAQNVRELIAVSAYRTPNAPALVAADGSGVTYRELLGRIDAIGTTLYACGVRRHDRVAIALPDGVTTAVTILAVASVAIACPLNPSYRGAEYEFYFSALEAETLVFDARVPASAAPVARARGVRIVDVANGAFDRAASAVGDGGRGDAGSLESQNVALMLHTSGTTARPKLVPLTHHNLVASARNIATWLDLSPADRSLSVMPLFHIHGIVGALLSSLAAGSSIVCTGGFASTEFFGALRERAATWYTAVPTMHQAIVARSSFEAPPSGLRFVRSSSAPLAPQTARALQQLFDAPVIEAYGMTEAAHQMCSNPHGAGKQRFGSVGLASGVAITIIDERGDARKPGEIGEVAIRGRSVMRGYDNNDAANADAFVRDWFRTGDLGRVDEDGYLYLVGRLKEMINRGGEKISPREIDDVLLEHPAVAQAIAFAIPDRRLGEEVAAAVVLAAGAVASGDDLIRFAQTRLADFKIPRRIVFRDALPLGPTGKPQRIGLATTFGLDRPEVAAASNEAPACNAAGSRYEAEMRAICCAVLALGSVGSDDDFFALGGDSISAARVIGRVRSECGRELAMTAFFGSPTIAGIARAIERSPESCSATEAAI